MTPRTESRILGLPSFRGPLGTDGAYASRLRISRCGRTGAIDVHAPVSEYDGAAHRENVVRRRRSLLQRILTALGGNR